LVGEEIPARIELLLFRKITCGPNLEKDKYSSHSVICFVKKQFLYHSSIYA